MLCEKKKEEKSIHTSWHVMTSPVHMLRRMSQDGASIVSDDADMAPSTMRALYLLLCLLRIFLCLPYACHTNLPKRLMPKTRRDTFIAYCGGQKIEQQRYLKPDYF